jgi:hypothetical protein
MQDTFSGILSYSHVENGPLYHATGVDSGFINYKNYSKVISTVCYLTQNTGSKIKEQHFISFLTFYRLNYFNACKTMCTVDFDNV